MSLSDQLFSAAQVRELDRCAIEKHGLPSILLMKRAGKAAFSALLERWPAVSTIHVFCGGGNNGGDGYVIAALAAQRGLATQVWQLSSQLNGAAEKAYQYALQEGVLVMPFDAYQWQKTFVEQCDQEGVMVDALLGTGFKGELSQVYSDAIDAINQSHWPVLSVDIPSGVDPDTGRVQQKAVRAQLTMSFIGQKLGNVIGSGRVHSGQRHLHSLDVPMAVYSDSQPPLAQRLNLEQLLPSLPARVLDAHKGDFGHLLVVGGDLGYGGAPLMSAQMALRSGAGLVSVATQPANTAAMIARQPELMAAGVVSGQELLPFLNRPSVIAVGPGLGQTAWSEQLLYHCLHAGKKMVVDADALNILAQGRLQLPALEEGKMQQWILTPHPGEAARLLGTTIEAVQQDRVSAIRALQNKYGGTVVLKGAGSLVLTSSQRLYVCNAGNPGMASGGMGDVLTGLLGALLAQGLTPDAAACLGVLVHASAADKAVEHKGERGLLASDLIPHVRLLLNQTLEANPVSEKQP